MKRRSQKGGAIFVVILILGICLPLTFSYFLLTLKSLRKIKEKCDLDVISVKIIVDRRSDLLLLVDSNLILQTTKAAIYLLRGLSVTGVAPVGFSKLSEQVLLRLNHQAYFAQRLILQKDAFKSLARMAHPSQFRCELIPALSPILQREATIFPDVYGRVHFPLGQRELSLVFCVSTKFLQTTRIELNGDASLQSKQFTETYKE